MIARPIVRVARVLTAVAICLASSVRQSSAQAFVPLAGEGSLTVSYQNLRSDGHLDLNGDRMEGESAHDHTYGHALVMEAEYGLTDRLAISGSIPYIRSRYDGNAPHHVLGGPTVQEWDNLSYHGTFQDFHAAVRYNLIRRPVAVTPSFEVVIPSHHYPSNAHAAVGKDLRAYIIGGAAGGFFDTFLPRMFFQTDVSYAWSQAVLDIGPNRSRANGELGYFITPRLSLRFLESFQVTHHGIDLLSFSPMTTGLIHGTGIEISGPYRGNHDRLQRSDYLTLGGGLGFELNDSLQVFVDAATMAWGKNVHPLRGITVGVNAGFGRRTSARP